MYVHDIYWIEKYNKKNMAKKFTSITFLHCICCLLNQTYWARTGADGQTNMPYLGSMTCGYRSYHTIKARWHWLRSTGFPGLDIPLVSWLGASQSHLGSERSFPIAFTTLCAVAQLLVVPVEVARTQPRLTPVSWPRSHAPGCTILGTKLSQFVLPLCCRPSCCVARFSFVFVCLFVVHMSVYVVSCVCVCSCSFPI